MVFLLFLFFFYCKKGSIYICSQFEMYIIYFNKLLNHLLFSFKQFSHVFQELIVANISHYKLVFKYLWCIIIFKIIHILSMISKIRCCKPASVYPVIHEMKSLQTKRPTSLDGQPSIIALRWTCQRVSCLHFNNTEYNSSTHAFAQHFICIVMSSFYLVVTMALWFKLQIFSENCRKQLV